MTGFQRKWQKYMTLGMGGKIERLNSHIAGSVLCVKCTRMPFCQDRYLSKENWYEDKFHCPSWTISAVWMQQHVGVFAPFSILTQTETESHYHLCSVSHNLNWCVCCLTRSISPCTVKNTLLHFVHQCIVQLIQPCLLYPGLACHGLKGLRNVLMIWK